MVTTQYQHENQHKLSLRRLRGSSAIRELTRELRLSHRQFIQPIFVCDGLSERASISSLTEVYRDNSESIKKQIEQDLERGVSKFLLFGVPKEKTLDRFNHDFLASQIKSLKSVFGSDIWLSVDVCLCSHTSHGQCGIIRNDGLDVDNQQTVAALAEQALIYAQSGADCVAPSDMMDHRVGAIRAILDANRYEETLIMSYAAKFHSQFYGPFRLAADSAPNHTSLLKDRRTYQIDPARPNDAFLCAQRDVGEGADILMVKPGLPYLDVLQTLSTAIKKPWAVYQVSGEYGAIELLAQNKLMNRQEGHLEAWLAFIRAGASMIISYGARNAREWLINGSEG